MEGLGELGGVWPPVGAVEADVEGVYEGLAGAGLEYGPVFRGLRGVWRRGEEVFAEVALGEFGGVGAGSFGLHPALLDAALHAVAVGGLGGDGGGGDGPLLPFAWGGVSLWVVGASVLRVRLARVDGGLSLVLAGEGGELVASVDSLVLRAVALDGFGTAGGLRIRCLVWSGCR